jgi:NAD-dependent deacetylase
VDDRLRLDVGDTHLMVLTGAGISVESGLSTYRAMNGLWNEHPVKDVATPYGFEADPGLAWRFWSERRAEAQRAQPNRGHAALVAPEELLADRFLLVTQNVDGLHQRAGSQRVVELHGSLHRSRCSKCGRPPFEDDELYPEGAPPSCELCPPGSAGVIRPAVVWFAEPIAQPDMDRVERFMARAARGRFVFLAVGTSGVVTPASAFVEEARKLGAETWLVNLEPPPNLDYFDHFIEGESGRVLPGLLANPAPSS